MAKIVRISDRDIADAVRGSASKSRSATILRACLETLLSIKGSKVSLDYVEDAIDSLVEYFISSSEAARCKRHFSDLYDEQQEATE